MHVLEASRVGDAESCGIHISAYDINSRMPPYSKQCDLLWKLWVSLGFISHPSILTIGSSSSHLVSIVCLLSGVQDAERRQAEGRAKQQQRQKEMEAAQQEAQERRHLLEEQKLLKLAGTSTTLPRRTEHHVGL